MSSTAYTCGGSATRSHKAALCAGGCDVATSVAAHGPAQPHLEAPELDNVPRRPEQQLPRRRPRIGKRLELVKVGCCLAPQLLCFWRGGRRACSVGRGECAHNCTLELIDTRRRCGHGCQHTSAGGPAPERCVCPRCVSGLHLWLSPQPQECGWHRRVHTCQRAADP